ncbi:hypothetical protein [Dongshaea marina]|uniref:hypothetical protein n=1 Tax=Dongshaea marina TaxID=2047966 RepID=UPI000D3E6B38|nr:hypothetical protein [Dongshaea marina]
MTNFHLKAFKIIFAALFVTSLLCHSVFATPAPEGIFQKIENTTPAQRATRQTQMMSKKLNLTPAQKSKVENINLKYAKKAQQIVDSDSWRLGKARELRELVFQKNDQLQAVLNHAQFEHYQRIQQQRMQAMVNG